MTRRDRFDGQFDTVLAAARTDAPWALERIFTALAPVVEGYMRNQGAAEPEDVTSEVFIAVFRNLGTFTGDEPGFRAWVFTIAHRRLQDARRAARRRPRSEPLTAADDRPDHDDVESVIDRRLADMQVRDLCDRLLPDQRDVLLMRILGRLTVDEVATALGKSPGAVKALQRRGLQGIARMLEREGVPL